MRRQRLAGIAALAYFGMTLVYGAFAALLGGLAALLQWLVGWWVVPFVFLGLGAAALLAYRSLLNEMSDLAIQQRETLIQQLVRETT